MEGQPPSADREVGLGFLHGRLLLAFLLLVTVRLRQPILSADDPIAARQAAAAKAEKAEKAAQEKSREERADKAGTAKDGAPVSAPIGTHLEREAPDVLF